MSKLPTHSAYPVSGSRAPAFHLPVVGGGYEDGAAVSLEELKGSKVVLYFYPKDDTPGCTTQACEIRDSWEALRGRAKVFGVSIDSAAKHRKFIDKHALPFPLLVDEEKSLAQAYGVWVEKSLYGKTYFGTERTTFVIDEEGKVAAVIPKVKPAEHVAKVLEALG